MRPSIRRTSVRKNLYTASLRKVIIVIVHLHAGKKLHFVSRKVIQRIFPATSIDENTAYLPAACSHRCAVYDDIGKITFSIDPQKRQKIKQTFTRYVFWQTAPRKRHQSKKLTVCQSGKSSSTDR